MTIFAEVEDFYKKSLKADYGSAKINPMTTYAIIKRWEEYKENRERTSRPKINL